jgi:hypothetical protein
MQLRCTCLKRDVKLRGAITDRLGETVTDSG